MYHYQQATHAPAIHTVLQFFQSRLQKCFLNVTNYLKEFMMIQFDPIFQPGDLGSWKSSGHAEKCDLPSQHVIQFEVRSFYYPCSLEILRFEQLTFHSSANDF